MHDGIEGNTVASPSLSDDLVIIGSSKPGQTAAFEKGLNYDDNASVLWIAEDGTSVSAHLWLLLNISTW